MRRASAVVAATFLVVAGVAAPSAAEPLPVCGTGNGSGEIPGQTCEAAVTAVAECDEDTAVLRYAVAGGAVSGSTVDIRWTGVRGGGVTLADQPLSGALAWPDGVSSAATLVFGTTPETTVTAQMPAECSESAVLAASSSSRSAARGEAAVLAATGSTVAPLAIGGGALVAAGAALVLLRRTRRQGV